MTVTFPERDPKDVPRPDETMTEVYAEMLSVGIQILKDEMSYVRLNYEEINEGADLERAARLTALAAASAKNHYPLDLLHEQINFLLDEAERLTLKMDTRTDYGRSDVSYVLDHYQD